MTAVRHIRTPVLVIGAGPAGLVLARLLHLDGVASIVLERAERDHLEKRTRAGLLEQGTVETLRSVGAADRLDREALIHTGFDLKIDGESHRLPFTDLTGARVWMYGQQEVVKDLIADRLAHGGELHFGVTDARVGRVSGDSVVVHCTIDGIRTEIECDFLAGCDGFYGPTRNAIPNPVIHSWTYPFAWLGVLAEAPPLSRELIYAVAPSGFALQSMRSTSVSRLYLQVPPGERAEERSDDEIWRELDMRITGGAETLPTGRVLERTVVKLRSFLAESVSHGALFLAGDAAHIVPPSAAKGLNLAVADARSLAEALVLKLRHNSREALDRYPAGVIRRAWLGQEFSAWMTELLHVSPRDSVVEHRLRRARVEHLTRSTAAATSFAEQYVGVNRG